MPIDPDRPIYPTWAPPLGTAASDDNVIALIRPNVGSDKSGTWAANAVCDEIVSRGLVAGEVFIILQNWGDSDTNYPESLCSLWITEDDQTEVASITITNALYVPFFDVAAAKCAAWSQAFVTRYLERQVATPAIPDPTAFFMDTEERIIVGSTWTEQWGAVKTDSRWSTEVITYDGRTWADVVSDDSIPDPAVPGGSGSGANRPHSRGVRPYLIESQSRAFDVGLFDVVRAEWPDVICANWRTTHSGIHRPTDPVEDQHTAVVGGTHECAVLYTETPAVFNRTFPLSIRPGVVDRPISPWVEFYGEAVAMTPTNYGLWVHWTVTQLRREHLRYRPPSERQYILTWGAPPPSGSMGSESNWNIWHAAVLAAEAAVVQPRNDSNTFILLGN